MNNVSRVQNSAVLLNRRRWILSTLLVLALLAFVGFSMLPLVEEVLRQNQPVANRASIPSETAVSAQQAELAVQARGYELVLQREPDNQTALRGLMETRLQLGDLKGSLEPLEKLAALNPAQSDYMVLLAQGRQKLGDREKSAQAYRAALAAQPENMNALQGLVSLLLEQQRPEAAIGLLQDKLKTATQVNQAQVGRIDTTSIQLMLGQVYFNQERYPEAFAVYDEAMKTNESDFRPVFAKALVLKQLGETARAEPLFTQAASLAPPQYKDQIQKIAAQASPPPTTPTPSPSPEASTTPKTQSPQTE